jgi:hypothetical protein
MVSRLTLVEHESHRRYFQHHLNRVCHLCWEI